MEPTSDTIKEPSQYQLLGKNTIRLIAASMTLEQWYGYSLGTIMGYRLRAGKKDSADQDLKKAIQHEILYEELKHLCKEE